MKMRSISLLCLFFLISQLALATATPFGDALANYSNSSIVENTGPYYPEKNWQPSNEWSQEHCRRKYSPYFVSGWLNILGFKNMSKINGIYYIHEEPASAAIIQYETNACTLGYPRYKGGWNYELEAYQQDDQVVAKLTATAILYYGYDGVIYYDNITRIFYDNVPLPERYNSTKPLNVTVTFFNNSYSPKTIIILEKDPWTVSERYTYLNQSIEHISKIGSIEKTTKGVKYVALYPANVWKNGNESLFSNLNDNVVIQGENFSMSNLTVTAIYPYGISVNSTIYNYNEIKYNPYETFHPLFYFISLLALIPLWVVSKITKRFKL